MATTRAEKRDRNRQSRQNRERTSEDKLKLYLSKISPATDNQRRSFEYYDGGKNLLLHGVPGSGKSFISLYLALEEVMEDLNKPRKVVIIRSAQSSKAIGFLPGSAAQKMEVFEAPYISICAKLFGRGDAYNILKQKGIVGKVLDEHLDRFVKYKQMEREYIPSLKRKYDFDYHRTDYL